MRRFLLILLGLIIAALAGIPLALSFYLPASAEQKAVESLAALGFQATAIQTMEARRGKVLLNNINLDDKGFSTAKSIEAQYSWTGFFTGRLIHTLDIDGLSLTGELTRDKKLSIAGWNPGKAGRVIDLSSIKTINIQNSNLDLMIDGIGGVNIKYDGQLRQTGLNGIEFKSTLSGTQRLFSADAKISGGIKESGLWRADLEIDQGKIDLPVLKATRISGTANMSGGDGNLMEFMMQLSAGGMALFDLPWHSVSATVEGNTHRYTILSEGKSVGQEGIEFTLGLPDGINLGNFSGSLHAQKLSDLFSYLKANKMITGETHFPALLDYMGALSLDFETSAHLQNPALTDIAYSIKDESGAINITGNGQIDNENKTAEGKLTMPSSLLSGPSKGSLLVNGEFETDFKDNNIKANGSISADLKDAVFQLGPFDFKNINTTLVFDDLSSLSTKKKQKASFSLALNSAIKQNGMADISVQNGNTITIDNPVLEVFGGKIASTPLTLGEQKEIQNFLLTLSNINLEQAGASLDIKGLALEGKLDGSLPIKIKDGSAFVQDGVFSNNGPGIIKFMPSEIPAVLQGDDLYLETARMALENYHYDFLEIRLNGPLTDNMQVTINAKGHNPDLFEKRPFALNLSTEMPLNVIFSNIFEEKKP